MRSVSDVVPSFLSNNFTLIKPRHCVLGCKGSQVQILSRRPFSPYKIKHLCVVVHKGSLSLRFNISHNGSQRFMEGRASEVHRLIVPVLLTHSEQLPKSLTQVKKSTNNKSWRRGPRAVDEVGSNHLKLGRTANPARHLIFKRGTHVQAS